MPRSALQQQIHEAVRQAILDAALELFVEHGYEEVSIRNIAAKVGYSPGAIYGYFPSKDDIFFALAEEGLRRLNAGDPANTPSESPLDDLRATAYRIHDFSKELPQFFALIFLDRHVPKISAEYGCLQFMGDVWQELEARVQRCIDEGLLPRDLHPFVALRMLISPIIGIASHRISNRLAPDEDVDALVADAVEVTIAGLQAGAQKRARAPAVRPFEKGD